MSSFESMTGTLASGSWGLHGGNIPENCTKGSGGVFSNNCTGRNAMAQRNWACDNIVCVAASAPCYSVFCGA
jgi:hypothetical protein